MLINCKNALNAIPTVGLDKEIALAVRLNRAGLERILNQEPSEDHEKLIEDFKIQWRRHSRVGGLTESLRILGGKLSTS